MDWLRQPVCGGEAQPGCRVEEQQEFNDCRRHGEVVQDEVQSGMRGGVKGVAGVEGEDVVGLPLLELPLRHEQGAPPLEPGRTPCCQSLTGLYRVSNSAICWMIGPVSSFMSSWPRAMGRESSSLTGPGPRS